VIGADAVLYKADGIKKLTESVKALLDNPPGAGDKPNVTLPGTVQKIIEPFHSSMPEKAEIAVHGADDLYREIRIENALTDEKGNQVKLKKGAHVEVTVEAEPADTTPATPD
jgi:hypothetical protein